MLVFCQLEPTLVNVGCEVVQCFNCSIMILLYFRTCIHPSLLLLSSFSGRLTVQRIIASLKTASRNHEQRPTH